MGEDEANYGLYEGEKDEHTDPNTDVMISDVQSTQEMLREPSPMPCIPAPVAFASELSIEEQLRYVKPVLVGILTGQYAPARAKHIGFMKGGKQRNAVTEAAWKRGEVTAQEKAKLNTCIRRWMQRRLKSQELGLIPSDPFVKVDDIVDTRTLISPKVRTGCLCIPHVVWLTVPIMFN